MYQLCEPAEENEPRTVGVRVTADMSREDLVHRILENGNHPKESFPWRDGNYHGRGGFFELLVLEGSEAIPLDKDDYKVFFKHGSFGNTSKDVFELSGEKTNNVEVKFEAGNKDLVSQGVVLDEGSKFIIETVMGVWILEWVSPQEMERLKNDGDPIEAPPSDHKLEPERLGRLIWITGAPGLGKSTTAQLLSKEHGYVYYEGDAFFGLRNPYLPPDMDNPSVAQNTSQRKLVGAGAEERRKMSAKFSKVWGDKLKGVEHKEEDEREGYRQLCADIARERARIGGDWAVAMTIDSAAIREFVR